MIRTNMFKDRQDAGRQLGKLLAKYKNKDVVVYAIPRGGVVLGAEVAKMLNAPLDLILAHKIPHPLQPEYAIAAVSESGHLVGSLTEGKAWIESEKERQMQEIKRKRRMYLKDKKEIPLKGKIAIIVDDGLATGLTMRVGILELKDKLPKKIVVAVPVAPRDTADLVTSMVDEFVALDIPDDFMGSVGAHYLHFEQVEDEEVISLLEGV